MPALHASRDGEQIVLSRRELRTLLLLKGLQDPASAALIAATQVKRARRGKEQDLDF